MPLGMEVGLGPGDFVFDGDPAAHQKKGTAPNLIFVLVNCGQMAGWIKMPLGTEVNLGPGDVVLDGVYLTQQHASCIHCKNYTANSNASALHCYRPNGMVCPSVCLSLTVVSPAKTDELIEMLFG